MPMSWALSVLEKVEARQLLETVRHWTVLRYPCLQSSGAITNTEGCGHWLGRHDHCLRHHVKNKIIFHAKQK